MVNDVATAIDTKLFILGWTQPLAIFVFSIIVMASSMHCVTMAAFETLSPMSSSQSSKAFSSTPLHCTYLFAAFSKTWKNRSTHPPKVCSETTCPPVISFPKYCTVPCIAFNADKVNVHPLTVSNTSERNSKMFPNTTKLLSKNGVAASLICNRI